jgi:hypothetical protein
VERDEGERATGNGNREPGPDGATATSTRDTTSPLPVMRGNKLALLMGGVYLGFLSQDNSVGMSNFILLVIYILTDTKCSTGTYSSGLADCVCENCVRGHYLQL